MKTAVMYQKPRMSYTKPAFPNAATRRQALHKFLDTLIMAAAGAGLGALLLLILALR